MLAACQSLPQAPTSAPQAQQPDRRTQVLREYGFEQTDEGWELQMSGKLLFDAYSVRQGAAALKAEAELSRQTGRTVHWQIDPALAPLAAFAQAMAV